MTMPASPLVLVVEDDHGVRRPLEKFLQMHDFTVVTAETADDAIDRWLFAGNRPAIREVHVGGRKRVHEGRHEDRDALLKGYKAAMHTLLA